MKGTLNYGILYKHSSTDNLQGYSDSDFASDTSDRKSVSGNIFMMQGGPVSWLSRKQTTVSMSTAEAEYVALSTCAQEAIWLTKLFFDITGLEVTPMTIYEDNQAAICIAKNNEFHSKTKHMDIKLHFVRNLVKTKRIEVKYLATNDMIADILTKPVPRQHFKYLPELCGIMEK